MNRDLRNIDDVVHRYLPSASTQETETAGSQVWHRLRFTRHSAVGDNTADEQVFTATVSGVPQSVWRLAAVAAVVIAAVGAAVVWRQAASPAVATVVEGSLTRTVFTYAEPIRADADSGAILSLTDGSRVEMRSQSELSIEPADDGTRIRLVTGSIIVNAAKQRSGHLYVQTKDLTVSVVGTVFLVNAEASGSRVAVIEGEVRVKEGRTETRLRPGDHVSTNPAIAPLPVKDAISWSRHADAHSAVLAVFTKGMAATSGPLTSLTPRALPAQAGQGGAAPPRPVFEEASVRQCDPDNLPETLAGARGGGPNSLQMTPGHLYVQCMTLATLIRTAYEYGPVELEWMGAGENPRQRADRGMRFEAVYGLGAEDGRRVRGGPDWIRSTRYTIEAVGTAQATAEMMRSAMLRDLLERRFQLQAHVEAEQIPAYALVVGPGGLKGMKPFRESDCGETSDAVKAERARKGWRGPVLITEAAYFGIKPSCGGVYGETNGPNYHFEIANNTPGVIAAFVGRSVGARVVDRTNVTDRFNFTWDFGIDEQTPGVLEELKQVKDWNPKPGWDSPMTIPKAPSIFAAVEQLGLKLEPIRVPREFIVIDRVERPSPN